MYNILVCDDDKEIVNAIEIYLTREGYNVIKAYNGVECINILKNKQVQLIILDVMMPILDGVQNLKIIFQNILTRRFWIKLRKFKRCQCQK